MFAGIVADQIISFTHIIATRDPATKPRSICTFVKRMNHRLRVPAFISPEDSAQPTLPAGYSPLWKRKGTSQSYIHAKRQRILFRSNSPNTNSNQESISRQCSQHSIHRPASICACAQSRKHNEYHSRHHQRPLPTPSIARVPKDQLPQDRACKRDRRDIRDRRAIGVRVRVERLEDSVDRTDDRLEVSVAEEAGAAGEGRHEALPRCLGGVLERDLAGDEVGVFHVVGGVVAVRDLLIVGHDARGSSLVLSVGSEQQRDEWSYFDK